MLRVKNLTPYYYASKATSRTPPQPEISFVVKASYKIVPGGICEALEELEQPFVTGDVFVEGDDDRNGALEYASDIADFKPKGEVLLRASAYAPGGSANSCMVKAEVGRWSKELLAVGPRAWKGHDNSSATHFLKSAVKAISGSEMTSEATPPTAFNTVPITLENAFGGPDYSANPVGTGHHSEYLPQIEYAGEPVKSPSSKVYPATFAPISSNWAERTAKFGKKYGKSYQERGRAPWYSEDMDWTYFNAAPHDQQIEGYWVGNEALRFTNMHRDHRVLETHLPGKRLRVFIKDVEQNFREIKLELDTIWIDLEKDVVTCLWRGLDPIADPMMQDVKWGVIGEENLADEPLPDEHYRQILEDYEKDPIGLGEDTLEKNKIFEEEGPTALKEKMEQDAAKNAAASANPTAAKANQADAMAAAMGAEPSNAGAAIEDALADYAAAAGKMNQPDAAARVTQSMADATAGSPQHISLMSGLTQSVGMLEKLKGEGLTGLEAVQQGLADPRLAQVMPGYTPPAPQPPALPAEFDKPPSDQFKQAWSDQQTEPPPPPDNALEPAAAPPPEEHPGESFDDQDLRGKDFSNWDLTGATFVGANLSGAIFQNAVLTRAVFDKANCSGVDFTGANFSEASAREATFVDATMSRADLRWTRFIAADMTRVKAEKADFSYAHLNNATAHQANFHRAEMEKARMQHGDFTQANFELARMRETISTGAVFTRAIFNTARLSAGDFTDATFTSITADGSMWHDATLTNARFLEADLLNSFFTGCKGEGVDFMSADLKKARMQDSNWQGARFIAANLFKADLARCNLLKATLQDANLYGAFLSGATIDNSTSMIGAITTAAKF